MSTSVTSTEQPISKPIDLVLKAPRLLLMGAIRVYQSTVGPALPRACRFEPSCSQYAYTALERYGVFRGTWLAMRRLARCQPFGGSGYDPVP
jgi:putative membrane protein insertion efficiency factor